MSITLDARSEAKLQGIHPDLVRVVHKAAAMLDMDFTVLEGLRTLARQKELFAHHATRTMKSRHLTGHAVDLGAMIAGGIRWDWPLYLKLAAVVKAAAAAENVPIRWGGTWKQLADTPEITAKVLSKTFPDGPHFELPSALYP